MRKTTYAYYFEIDGKKTMIKLGDYLKGKREAYCEDKVYRSIPFFISKKINEDLVARRTLTTPFRYHVLKQDKGVIEKAVILIRKKKNKAITCIYENGLFSLENTNDIALNKLDREYFKKMSMIIFIDEMIECTDINIFSITEERKQGKAIISVESYLKPISKDLSDEGYLLKIPSGDIIVSDEEFDLEELEKAWEEDNEYWECEGMYCRLVHREIADLLPMEEREVIDLDTLKERLRNG